jgi:hypothetical protein
MVKPADKSLKQTLSGQLCEKQTGAPFLSLFMTNYILPFGEEIDMDLNFFGSTTGLRLPVSYGFSVF